MKLKNKRIIIAVCMVALGTLLMLVSALADKETVMGAYEEAVREKYRFFSFGDAMFIK